jgi:hypothetical protein
MKKTAVFVLAATCMLLGGAYPLFADGSKCRTACHKIKTNISVNKLQPGYTAAFETDPFTILIPGNHF